MAGNAAARLAQLARQFTTAAASADQALRDTITGSARPAVLEVTRVASKRFNQTPDQIARGVTVTADTSRLRLTVAGGERRPLVTAFGARQTSGGVLFTIERGRPETAPRAFIPRVGRARTVPLQRVGRSQYPIRALRGPSPAQMLAAPGVAQPALLAIERVAGADATKRTAALLTKIGT